MSLPQATDAWHAAQTTVEAALRSGYDFKRDRDKLEETCTSAFRVLRSAATELRDGGGAIRRDVHEMLAQAVNRHRELIRLIAVAKQVKQRRRSQIERRILDEVEVYWMRDQRSD